MVHISQFFTPNDVSSLDHFEEEKEKSLWDC